MKYTDFDRLVNVMRKQWVELKDSLNNGTVEYNQIEKLYKNTFFRQFDNLLKNTAHFFEVPIYEMKPIYRGVSGDVDLSNDGRMMPQIKYSNNHNRMNPPGKAFLYTGVSNDYSNSDKQREHVIKTVLKEIRANRDSVVTICKIGIKDTATKEKIINICGDDNIPKPEHELNDYIIRNIATSDNEIDKEKLSCILANVYMNMLSSDKIFEPVNDNCLDVRKFEYAPFQALAHYFSEQGYAGMMYRSTVHKNGTNLVLFDPNYAFVIKGSMEHINASDYL